MKITNALALIIVLLMFSCVKEKKSSTSQVISRLEHIKNMDLSEADNYFDSIGYLWMKDDELKDSVIKYYNKIDSSEFYLMKLSKGTLENAVFKTNSLEVFLDALKTLKGLGYKETGTNTTKNSVVSAFKKNNLELASAKIKNPGSKLFYLFVLDNSAENSIKNQK